MEFLFDSFFSSLLLLWAFDPELVEIVSVSLKVSSTSTIIASMVGTAGAVVRRRVRTGLSIKAVAKLIVPKANEKYHAD